MDEIKYSVLMSVYHKEQPEYLRDSINSMLNQTLKPDEIVLVKDGPLTEALEKIIYEYKDNPILNVVELKENVGLGKALNIGLTKCRNEIVARMDTDDISKPDRCEKQLNELVKDLDISVIGSSVGEFISEPSNIIAYRDVELEHSAIKIKMKYRNPMNHPSVMYRKNDVLISGSYKHWFLNEDYYLWIRMMQQGFKFANIGEPLVNMRITNETYLRRGGWKYFITQKKLFDYMLKSKFINIFEYLYNNSLRLITRILIPNQIRKLLYLKILRKKQISQIK
jgi:glycosyltransferase involved in cell wall biosynthesis